MNLIFEQVFQNVCNSHFFQLPWEAVSLFQCFSLGFFFFFFLQIIYIQINLFYFGQENFVWSGYCLTLLLFLSLKWLLNISKMKIYPMMMKFYIVKQWSSTYQIGIYWEPPFNIKAVSIMLARVSIILDWKS